MKPSTVEFQGDVLKLTTQSTFPRRETKHIRGKVSVFSRKSRKRLLEKLARTKDTKMPRIFLTLTYQSNMTDPQKGKHHLRAFLERVRRLFPKASAFWRLEFQKRGAVHFHFIFFNLPYWKADDIRKVWSEIIDEDNPRIEIETCRSKRKSTYYVSKYMAKPSRDALVSLSNAPYPHVGRHWGVFNKDEIPMAELVLYEFFGDSKSFWDLKRAITKIIPKLKGKYGGGVLLFCNDVDMWRKYWDVLYLA